MPRFWLMFRSWAECKSDKTRGTSRMTKTTWPLGVMFPQSVVFMGLVRISFTHRLNVVNDKKKKKKVLLCSIISLFFCFCPPHPSPHPTRTPHWWHMGAELSWQTHHPLLSGPLESPTTPGPPSEHRRAGHSAGIWTGWWEHLGKKRKRNRKGRAVASSLSPLLHSFLEERLLANLRQQLWILRHVLFGRCDYFHRKNIFIDKTLSVVRGCFVRCFVWFARPWRELCLPYDLWKTHNSKNDSFVSEGNNACLFGEAIIGNIFKKKKKKKKKSRRDSPQDVSSLSYEMMIFDIFWGSSFADFSFILW